MDYLELCFDKNTNIVFRKIADEVVLVPIRQEVGDLANIVNAGLEVLNTAEIIVLSPINIYAHP
jgi:hypothetical protein